jgi:hypothetical protein
MSNLNNVIIQEYTQEDIQKIEGLLLKKFNKAFEINSKAVRGIPLYKSIFFILDKISRGNYYGTIMTRVEGNVIQDPREQDITHKLDFMYNLEDLDL